MAKPAAQKPSLQFETVIYSDDTRKSDSAVSQTAFIGKKSKHEFVIVADRASIIALGDTIFQAISALPDMRLVLADEDIFSEHTKANKDQQQEIHTVQLFLSKQLDTSIKPLINSLRAGCVPIVPVMKKLKGVVAPFDPVKETGNAFFYTKEDIWNVFATLIQAREAHRFPYDWDHLVETCKAS